MSSSGSETILDPFDNEGLKKTFSDRNTVLLLLHAVGHSSKPVMPSLSSLQPSSVFLIILLCYRIAVASPFPAPSDFPTPYELQSTGVICSRFFGNPVASDCHGILSTLSTGDLYQWFESSLAPSTAADTVSLPWSDTIGEFLSLRCEVCPLFFSPSYCRRDGILICMLASCALDIDIQPGARNNVSWATITHIAQNVLSSCSSLAGTPGGWGIYGQLYCFSTNQLLSLTMCAKPTSPSSSPPPLPRLNRSRKQKVTPTPRPMVMHRRQIYNLPS